MHALSYEGHTSSCFDDIKRTGPLMFSTGMIVSGVTVLSLSLNFQYKLYLMHECSKQFQVYARSTHITAKTLVVIIAIMLAAFPANAFFAISMTTAE